jgi:tetratricopeptide (TPR) repeat protein/glycosyltransferase involved in cell wall biosynthesis
MSGIKVLFIYQGIVPSTYIRLINPFNLLAERGDIDYRGININKLSNKDIQWADIVIFHRVDSDSGLTIMEELHDLKKHIIYETDDNWVSPPPEYHPAFQYHSRVIVRNTVERLIKESDAVCVSTERLKESFSGFNPRTLVIPNTVDFRYVGRPLVHTDEVRIAYAGTKTHRGDFEVLLPVIKRISKEYDKVRFVFLGYTPEELRDMECLEEWTFNNNYNEYLSLLGSLSLDIAIAPLTDNEFNRHKSNIKYLEYSACNIAGIYSRVPAYEGTVQDGVTGLLVKHTEDEWYTALKSLIESPEKRKKISRKAFLNVKQMFSVDRASKDWQCLFESLLSEKMKTRKKAIAKKRIFYIGSGMLYPHVYIDDMIVRALSMAGYDVLYYPLQEDEFFASTLSDYKAYPPEYRELILQRAKRGDEILMEIKQLTPDIVLTTAGLNLPRDMLYELRKREIKTGFLYFPVSKNIKKALWSEMVRLSKRFFDMLFYLGNDMHLEIDEDIEDMCHIQMDIPEVLNPHIASTSDVGMFVEPLKKIVERLLSDHEKRIPQFYNSTIVDISQNVRFQSELIEGAQTFHMKERRCEDLRDIFLMASSPYTFLIGSIKVVEARVREAMKSFSTMIDLACEIDINNRGDVEFMALSNRHFWRNISWRDEYKDINYLFWDIVYQFRAKRLRVHVRGDERTPYKIKEDELTQDIQVFKRYWGDDPEKRLKAINLLSLGMEMKKKNEEMIAYQLIRKAIEVDPYYSPPYRETAAIDMTRGDLEKAGALLETAVEYSFDDIPTKVLYGVYLTIKGEPLQAIAQLSPLLDKAETVNDMATILCNLGKSYIMLGDISKGEDMLKKAVQLDGLYKQAMKELLGIYFGQGRLMDALEIAEKIVVLDPNDADALNDLAVVIYSLGRIHEAYGVINKVLTIKPDHKEALRNMKAIERELGLDRMNQNHCGVGV